MAWQARGVDLSNAAVTVSDDGAVLIDAPDAPWLIHARTARAGRRLVLAELCVVTRDDGQELRAAAITDTRLGRLPVRQILHVAATHQHAAGDPAELYWRLAAQPKPPGARRWPDNHWPKVLAVYEWGRRTRRPGGGVGAVCDLWQCSPRTAARWLATARARATGRGRRRPAGGGTDPPPGSATSQEPLPRGRRRAG